MPRVEVWEVTCGDCGQQTTVVETVWPATRHEPADGEIRPEECPRCGKPWDRDEDEWEESEPPEPDHDDDRGDEYGQWEPWT